ncbi:hypothetical protein BH09PSE2_BH09PSE2_16280 [soil metagenome]
MRKKLAITLSVASLLAAPVTLIAVATPAMAQTATVGSVRASIQAAIASARADAAQKGLTQAQTEAAILNAMKAAIAASNASPSVVQLALNSLGNVASVPVVTGPVAQLLQQIASASEGSNGANSTGGGTSGGGQSSGGSFGGGSFGGSSGVGGGGSDYRT